MTSRRCGRADLKSAGGEVRLPQMKDLWRATVKLLKRYPVLWAPTLSVTICVFGVFEFSGSFVARILGRLMTSQSVLGFDAPAGDINSAMQRTLHLFVPIGVLLEYLSICLWVCALIVTARLVKMVMGKQDPRFASALAALREGTGSILWFAFKFAACVLAQRAVTWLFFELPLPDIYRDRTLSFASLNCALSLILSAGTAWLLCPGAVKLLLPAGRRQLSRETAQLARRFGIHVAILISVLWYAWDLLQSAITIDRRWEDQMDGLIAALSTSLPLVALFVAIGLLSVRREGGLLEGERSTRPIET